MGGIADVERPQISEFELDGDCTSVMLTAQRRQDDLRDISIQRGWQMGDAKVLEVARAKLVLHRKKLGAIRCGGGEPTVVEREQQGIVIRNPEKTWWGQACAHRHAVPPH